jgi:hypothetical protein
MTLPPNDAVAIVMTHPDPGAGPTPPDPPAEGWEHVPSLYVVDPDNARSDEYSKHLASASRAWNLRCFVHDSDPAAALRGERGTTPGGSTWALQSANFTRSFLLEQSFYWRLHHRREDDTT